MTTSPLIVIQSKMLSGAFDEAHALLKAIPTDPKTANDVRADALIWLGTLARVHPAPSPDDESGLTHFRRALECSPNSLWAMVGAINSLGEHFPDHQDFQLVRDLIPRVRLRYGELNEGVQRSIEEKAVLSEKLARIRKNAQ